MEERLGGEKSVEEMKKGEQKRMKKSVGGTPDTATTKHENTLSLSPLLLPSRPPPLPPLPSPKAPPHYRLLSPAITR